MDQLKHQLTTKIKREREDNQFLGSIHGVHSVSDDE